jgi:hypothetical protein
VGLESKAEGSWFQTRDLNGWAIATITIHRSSK